MMKTCCGRTIVHAVLGWPITGPPPPPGHTVSARTALELGISYCPSSPPMRGVHARHQGRAGEVRPQDSPQRTSPRRRPRENCLAYEMSVGKRAWLLRSKGAAILLAHRTRIARSEAAPSYWSTHHKGPANFFCRGIVRFGSAPPRPLRLQRHFRREARAHARQRSQQR